MNLYLKINGKEYDASFTGRNNDTDWGGRESKTIKTNQITFSEASTLFVDGVGWSIVEETFYLEVYAYDADGNVIHVFVDEEGNPVPLYDKDGNPIDEPLTRQASRKTEYDNSAYNIAGSITDNRDNSISIKMGKQTALEEAYELLYGGLV